MAWCQSTSGRITAVIPVRHTAHVDAEAEAEVGDAAVIAVAVATLSSASAAIVGEALSSAELAAAPASLLLAGTVREGRGRL